MVAEKAARRCLAGKFRSNRGEFKYALATLLLRTQNLNPEPQDSGTAERNGDRQQTQTEYADEDENREDRTAAICRFFFFTLLLYLYVLPSSSCCLRPPLPYSISIFQFVERFSTSTISVPVEHTENYRHSLSFIRLL